MLRSTAQLARQRSRIGAHHLRVRREDAEHVCLAARLARWRLWRRHRHDNLNADVLLRPLLLLLFLLLLLLRVGHVGPRDDGRPLGAAAKAERRLGRREAHAADEVFKGNFLVKVAAPADVVEGDAARDGVGANDARNAPVALAVHHVELVGGGAEVAPGDIVHHKVDARLRFITRGAHKRLIKSKEDEKQHTMLDTISNNSTSHLFAVRERLVGLFGHAETA